MPVQRLSRELWVFLFNGRDGGLWRVKAIGRFAGLIGPLYVDFARLTLPGWSYSIGVMKHRPSCAAAMFLAPAAACAVLVMGVLSGCGEEKKDPLAGLRRDAKVLFTPPPKIPAGTVVSDMGPLFYISVTRFDLPFEFPQDISGLWRVLSVRGFSPATLAKLSVNGIQIGKGSLNRAGELEKVLADLGAEVRSRSMVTALQGKPSSVGLNRHADGCTIFMLRPDMTMVGKDYSPGRSLLAVSCSPAVGGRSSTELTFLPQIKTNRRRAAFVRDQAGYAIRHSPDVSSFYSLVWRTVLSGQDFLVIGPSLAAVSESSLGHQFLLRESAGKRVATLLLLRVRIAGSSAGPR